jgi:hypothetical protein
MQGLTHSLDSLDKIAWVDFEMYLNKTFERRCGRIGFKEGELACGFKFM